MSPRALKQVSGYFLRRGYQIIGSGGDKIIKAPPGASSGGRAVVRIGHKYCSRPGDVLLPAYVSAIRRAFGVTRRDILDDR